MKNGWKPWLLKKSRFFRLSAGPESKVEFNFVFGNYRCSQKSIQHFLFKTTTTENNNNRYQKEIKKLVAVVQKVGVKVVLVPISPAIIADLEFGFRKIRRNDLTHDTFIIRGSFEPFGHKNMLGWIFGFDSQFITNFSLKRE